MTVAELIILLKKQNPTTKVVIDKYSDYIEVTTVEAIMLLDKGGYVGYAYTPEEKSKQKEFLLFR